MHGDPRARLRPPRSRGSVPALLLLAAVSLVALPASGTTWRVGPHAPDLAAALARAATGDTVLVAPGCYPGTFRIERAIAVIASAGPDSTILDGGGAGPVVTFDEVDASALLDGFTITGGLLAGEEGDGAGILCKRHASPRIHHNVIRDNRALGDDGRGGGIACLDGSNPVIANNEIEANEAAWGGGIYAGKRGGWHSSPLISSNRLFGNRARRGGGGLAVSHASEPVITGNVLAWNASLADGGGAIHISRGRPVIRENTLWANEDPSGITSGVCLVDYAAPTIDHNIIAAGVGAPAVHCVALLQERQAITCNNVWNPGRPEFASGCAVYPGNITVDPELCDPDGRNFSLTPTSPCLAHASCGRIGALSIGCSVTP